MVPAFWTSKEDNENETQKFMFCGSLEKFLWKSDSLLLRIVSAGLTNFNLVQQKTNYNMINPWTLTKTGQTVHFTHFHLGKNVQENFSLEIFYGLQAPTKSQKVPSFIGPVLIHWNQIESTRIYLERSVLS